MGTQLHQMLRTLCFNSEWQYAVFWKLDHQARTVIGHVAATGRHMWIFADEHETDMSLPFEHFDGWRNQFSAGIRTVVLVPIFPHGVVQLGSLNKVPEVLKMLNHIRDIFSAHQHCLLGRSPSVGHSMLNSSSCLIDISSGSSVSGNFLDCISSIGRPVSKDDMQHTLSDHAYAVPLLGNLLKKTDEVTSKDRGIELSASWGAESAILVKPGSEVFLLEQHEQVRKSLLIDRSWKWESGSLGYLGVGSEVQDTTSSAGSELYEVCRPGFESETIYYNLEAENMENETATEMPEGMDSSSLLTVDSGSDNLLEAVVANACRGGNNVKIEKSESVKSTLMTGAMPLTTCNDQSLIEMETVHCLSSEAGGVSSSKGFLSRIHSTFDGPLDNAKEPAKVNRKRARPDENSRPRPRDRQLIQHRVKKLREIVPSGSKCSIDSLLERTIKHMLFMQSTIKRAEKLKPSTKPKLLSPEPVVRGLPIHDQGSTWAVELGSHLNFCPIMIENVNMNGQMLIEMMCEDCSHFLKIAEAISSLGLIILKGTTKACGKKTRMCFVVEEDQNRSIHRLDILWTLVPILQSRASL
ncbi:transcription factor bHLH155-like isoform X2 [Diospyros lotus]|uniref:transcription factor bHLH155-like isoform X2 n=1 Tax=Diospyros lotus TaxID=55363 RepID=UPI002258C265|nr:transcription factor bHLH155-like isoform X2 [Diospyros lotus]